MFDMATGQCEIDPSACGPGTALVDGVCVNEDDAMSADLQEAAEPNDDTGAGQFDIPAEGSATTLHGCITPSADGDRDYDPWIMHADGPMVVEITADGVHGLSGGFEVLDASQNPLLADYQRVGANLTGDTSKRQVYLPAAGDYVLLMDDSRAILFGEAAGSADTCYFGTVKHVATPAATPVGFPDSGANSGEVEVRSFTAAATGDIFVGLLGTTSTAMIPSVSVTKKGMLQSVASGDSSGNAAIASLGGFDVNDEALLFIDPVYNFALAPQPWTLDAYTVGAQPLPLAGETVTTTSAQGDATIPAALQYGFYYFDVPADGAIEHFNLVASGKVQLGIVRENVFTSAGSFDTLVPLTSTAATTWGTNPVRFAKQGRYYVRVLPNPAVALGSTYTVTNTLTNLPTTPVTYGTAQTGQTLKANNAFFTFDKQDANKWTEFDVTDIANWGGTKATVTLYSATGEGEIGTTAYPAIQTATFTPPGSIGRVVANDGTDYLVRVQSQSATATGTFTLKVGDRPFTDLGTVAVNTNVTRMNETVAANGLNRYLVAAPAGDIITITATPKTGTDDPVVTQLSITEGVVTSSSQGAGVDNVLVITQDTTGYTAFTIDGDGAAAGYDLTVAVAPPFYTKHTGTTAYADICATGTVQTLTATSTYDADDEGLTGPIATPAGFQFYGVAAPQLVVSTNGFLSFNTGISDSYYTPAALPDGIGDASVAAFWDDMFQVQVCTKTVNNKLVIQWTGLDLLLSQFFGEDGPIQAQAILDPSDSSIELVYGPQQITFSYGGASSGVQNLDGTQGLLTGDGLDGSDIVTPSSAIKITHP